MCRKKGVPTTKNLLIAAVKNVSSALQIASNEGGLSSTTIIKISSMGGPKLAELKEYQERRSDEKTLIASVNGDVRNNLDVPLLEVSKSELSESNFCVELAKILLEPKCCIYFDTKNVTKIGLERISSLLNKFADLWDSRVLILLECQDKLPAILSRYVEKSFDTKALESVTPSQHAKKMKLSDSVTSEFHNECLLKRDGEIHHLKGELKISAENVLRYKLEIKKLQEENEIQEGLAKTSELELKNVKESVLKFEEKMKKGDEDEKLLESKLASALGENERIETLLLKEVEEHERLKDSLKDAEIKNSETKREIEKLVEQNKMMFEKLENNTKHESASREPVKSVDSIKKIKDGDNNETNTELLESASKVSDKSGDSNEVTKGVDIIETNAIQLESASRDIDKPEDSNKEVKSVDNNESTSVLQSIKSSILKYSSNLKLSRKTVVIRSIKHLKIDESYVVSEEDTMCELNIKEGPYNILAIKYFSGTGRSKTKSQESAYSNMINFLTS